MKKKINKYFLLIILFQYTNSLYAQKETFEHLVMWSEKELLTWRDYKKVSKTSVGKKAVSHIGLRFVPIFDTDTLAKLEVLPYFDKRYSITYVLNDKLLKHEQFHFNIAELYARKIRKRFSEIDSKNAPLLTYNLIVNSLKVEYNSYQINYDRNTNHGVKFIDQKNWEKKITLELEKLKAYKLKYSF
jgi:hypothetical protein